MKLKKYTSVKKTVKCKDDRRQIEYHPVYYVNAFICSALVTRNINIDHEHYTGFPAQYIRSAIQYNPRANQYNPGDTVGRTLAHRNLSGNQYHPSPAYFR